MTLSHSDASDLDAYYRKIAEQEKSTAGPQWEKAEVFAHEPAHHADGWTKLDENDNVVTTGLGWSQYNENGEEITAWPTAEATLDAKGEPDLSGSEMVMRVSRRLKALSGRYQRALEALYGDIVAESELPKVNGRMELLYPLTKAGRVLRELRRRVDRAARGESYGEAGPLPNQEVLEGLAYQSALDLKGAAEDAYTAVADRDRAERAAERERRRPRNVQVEGEEL